MGFGFADFSMGGEVDHLAGGAVGFGSVTILIAEFGHLVLLGVHGGLEPGTDLITMDASQWLLLL
jgi:hypothetical protein